MPERFSPDEIPVVPRRISPSVIGRFAQCRKTAWYRFATDERGPDVPLCTFAVGNAVHGALDKLFGLSPGQRNTENAELALRSVWREHVSANVFESALEEAEHGMTALRLMASFVKTFDTNARPLCRERWVSVKVDGGIEIYGKVDRVDPSQSIPGTVEVVDYKTTGAPIDRFDLPDDIAAQAYALATSQLAGKPVTRVRYLYLAHGKEVVWEVEEEDLQAARERLTSRVAEMRAEAAFPPSPGAHCSRCAYALVCPAAGRVDLSDLSAPADLGF